jgi:hypothetical protein
VSRERYKRKPEVIQLPLLGLDEDHTDADAALGCSSDGRMQKLPQAFPQCPLRGSRIVYDL